MSAASHVSPCALLGLGFGLCLAVSGLSLDSMAIAPPSAPVSDAGSDPATQADPLRGLWMRYDGRGEGDPLRFWYFHGDGKGLYRYGKVGLANTNSFDYAPQGGAITSTGTDTGAGETLDFDLRFRKSGDAHELTAALDQDSQGRTWMTLHGDPREPGARYRKIESELDFADLAQGDVRQADAGIGDRIWIDYRRHATGGTEFHMYQLAATAIDGRGVGWFHRGDFDDWSTESLTYRIDGDHLELFFDLREEPSVTSFAIVEGAKGRELVLESDPRDYWARHRYRDGGRSFSAAFDVVAGLERALAER